MIQSWELLTLVFLALLIFGPERLPGMLRTVGRTVGRLRAEATSTMEEIKRTSDYEELRQSAGLDELRELRNELRSEGAALSSNAESLRKDARLDDDGFRPGVPAPYDPDAT